MREETRHRDESEQHDAAESGRDGEDGEGRRPGDDPVERFARNGFSALERFGAELEAMFVGAPTPVASTPSSEGTLRPASPPAPRPTTLAAIEAELARQLMEEGVVVRGHDVARVVGLMAGTTVTWQETS